MTPTAAASHREVQQLLARRDLVRAAEACRALTAAHPRYAPGWVTASRIMLALGRPAEALENIDIALSLAANDPEALLHRSYCQHALGRTAAALAVAATLRKAAAGRPALLDAVGTFYSTAGEQKLALAAYDAAIAIAPRDARFRYNRATVRRFVGDLDGAEADYDEAIALDPRDCEAYANRSELRPQTSERNHIAVLESLIRSGVGDWYGEVQLRHALANGDVVEIMTQKGHEPSRDWLNFVRTSRARSKIRQWINLHERTHAIEVGRRLLEKEARHSGLSLKKIAEEDWLRVASEYGCGRVEDLHAELGYGKWSARQVLAKATGQQLTESPEEKQPKLVSTVKKMLGIGDSAIFVRGHDDLMVYRAKCCNPIPGDEITGYVTRGRGIAVHSKNCPNVQNLLYEADRRMPVEWAGASEATFPVRLRILTEDRPGILAGVTGVISESGANIRTFESGGQDMRARIEVALDVHDRKQLERILTGVKRIPGVFDIERVYNV